MIRSIVTGGLYSTIQSARVAIAHRKNRKSWYASRTKSDKAHPLKKLNRNAVWHAVKVGRMLPARALPCFDCRKEARVYDHFKGHHRKYRFVVQAICLSCSIRRDQKRGYRKVKKDD